ncbi:MAG: endonuclease/exonuclease/phosphatase family protein [Treponemataceae bacterium]|nr:endonuclease/exonuclease/phosphatase family protein [Treponemataceae bacterium]
MKNRMYMLPLAAAAFCCCSCGAEGAAVSVVNWNVQTFFDAVNDGCEYSEFQKSGWNEQLYSARLDRLCDSIKKMDADIFVFEEIENGGVLYDIANRLAGLHRSRPWKYACFSKNQNEAIGCAVLSRVPIRKATVHALAVSSEAAAQPAMRPVMKVILEAGGGRELALFVNHWKSKSGGAAKSEVWRNWQESLLASLIARTLSENSGAAVLACGDFNRDILEFKALPAAGMGGTGGADGGPSAVPNVALRLRTDFPGRNAAGAAGFYDSGEVAVHSPWFSEGGLVPPGSYYYQDEWSRIDHFFAAGGAAIASFSPQADGGWCGADGVPWRFTMYNGRGYSDHLPIRCSVAFP